jgi:hypothetical protein
LVLRHERASWRVAVFFVIGVIAFGVVFIETWSRS